MCTLEGHPLEDPSCGGSVPTAETTVNPAYVPTDAGDANHGQDTDGGATPHPGAAASGPCLRSDTPSSVRPFRPHRPEGPRISGNAAALSAQPVLATTKPRRGRKFALQERT